MKTLVIYYSYSGRTKVVAEQVAGENSADLAEILDAKRPGTFKAYTAGCIAALKGKTWPILPLEVDFGAYDRLILMAPIWASNPAPAFNSILEVLPEGKTVVLKMISASGESKCKERLESLIAAKGCKLESFEDVKVERK